MTIQQAANELGVSTKTLRRWEAKGFFVPVRQEVTNVRLYKVVDIEYWKKFINLDKALREHLNNLLAIRKALDKFIITTPLNGDIRPPLNGKEFMRAHKAMTEWDKKYKQINQDMGEFACSMFQARKDIK